MEGKELDVLAHARRNGCLHLTLVLPDGTRSLIPASWTDMGKANTWSETDASNPISLPAILGSVSDLLCTRKVVDALLQKLAAKESAANSHSKEESNCATTGLLARPEENALRARALGGAQLRGSGKSTGDVGSADCQSDLSEIDRRYRGENT